MSTQPQTGDSFQANQNFNSLLASENNPSSSSSLEAINSLLTLRKALDPSGTSGKASGINALLDSEIKYVDSAARALTADSGSGKLLRAKFGSSLSSALALSSVLRQRNQQRIGDEIINNVLEANATTKRKANENWEMATDGGTVTF